MTVTRRNFIVTAATSSLASVTAETSANPIAPGKSKLKVVVAGGHPGDPEYGCGGTAAMLASLGHEVVLLYLNDGAWPPTPASTRKEEAINACRILKTRPAYAGQTNGHAVVDQAHCEDFQNLIAREAPDALITQWPLDNHADHRAISMLCYDSWQKLSKKFALYYYEVSDGEDTLQFSPNRYVDITNFESTKKEACYAHASQTPDRYYELQDTVARFRGIESGYKRAEAFLLQIQSPFDIFSKL